MSHEQLIFDSREKTDIEIFSEGPQYEGVLIATKGKSVVSLRVAFGPNNPGCHISPALQAHKELLEERGYHVVITSNGEKIW